MPTFHDDTPCSEFVNMTATQYSHNGIIPLPDDELYYSITLSAKRLGFLGFIRVSSDDPDSPRFDIILNIKYWNGRKEITTLSLDHRSHQIIVTNLDRQNQPISSQIHLISEGEISTIAPFSYQLY